LELLLDLKKEKKDYFPRIGINYVITPDNFEFIENLFLNVLNLDHIDKIIIANQFFINDNQFSQFSQFLKSFFQIEEGIYAKPRLYNQNKFDAINIGSIVRQLNRIQEECTKRGVNLLTLPDKIDFESLHNYYFDWEKNLSTHKNCVFPWRYAEISAKGDVSVCHTFYEMTFGNMKNDSLLKIWNNDKINKFRQYLNRNTLPICTACCYFYIQGDKRNKEL
jgi:radical SAM protein with 4Fe4S-binding SPASM domain